MIKIAYKLAFKLVQEICSMIDAKKEMGMIAWEEENDPEVVQQMESEMLILINGLENIVKFGLPLIS